MHGGERKNSRNLKFSINGANLIRIFFYAAGIVLSIYWRSDHYGPSSFSGPSGFPSHSGFPGCSGFPDVLAFRLYQLSVVTVKN
jgi:hypothetical protein